MIDPSILARRKDCWLWAGVKGSRGYGKIRIEGRYRPAHRILYEAFTGIPVPDDKVPDHLCEVPACINPAHIEIVTQQENTKRGNAKKRRTHCMKGHLFTPDSVVVSYNRYGSPQRTCRECMRVYKVKQWLRTKKLNNEKGDV